METPPDIAEVINVGLEGGVILVVDEAHCPCAEVTHFLPRLAAFCSGRQHGRRVPGLECNILIRDDLLNLLGDLLLRHLTLLLRAPFSRRGLTPGTGGDLLL